MPLMYCVQLSSAGLKPIVDDRPMPNVAEYRCASVIYCKVWLTPTTRVPCSNTAKMRNLLKFARVPQARQQFSTASGPKLTILSGHVRETLLFNIFFRIVDTCLRCEDIARRSCAMVPRWQIFGDFLVLHFQRATHSTFQTSILNLH